MKVSFTCSYIESRRTCVKVLYSHDCLCDSPFCNRNAIHRGTVSLENIIFLTKMSLLGGQGRAIKMCRIRISSSTCVTVKISVFSHKNSMAVLGNGSVS